MDQAEEESSREKEIIINFAKRLDNALTQKSKEDDFDEDGAFFEIDDVHGRPRLATLRKVDAENIEHELICADKELPTDISYLELTLLISEEQRSITNYFLSLKGDCGVLRRYTNNSYETTRKPSHIEDLKRGDYENLAWVVQNIENQL